MKGRKKVPEHKDSMKKNSFLQEITPPPPPSKVKWSAPKYHCYVTSVIPDDD